MGFLARRLYSIEMTSAVLETCPNRPEAGSKASQRGSLTRKWSGDVSAGPAHGHLSRAEVSDKKTLGTGYATTADLADTARSVVGAGIKYAFILLGPPVIMYMAIGLLILIRRFVYQYPALAGLLLIALAFPRRAVQ